MKELTDKSSHFKGEQRLYMIVARRIARLIDDNRSDSSWRMPTERGLAEMLGVGRPVVREAVIALEMRGIVEVKGRAGIRILPQADGAPYARQFDFQQGAGLAELIDARFALETNAAFLAAERATPYDLAVLEQCVAEVEAKRFDPVDLAEADRCYHTTVAEMTANPLVSGMVHHVRTQWENSPLMNKTWNALPTSTLLSLWIGDHHAILSALRMRQPNAAYKAVARYLKNLREELEDVEVSDEPASASGRGD